MNFSSLKFVILLSLCLKVIAQCPTVDPNFPGSCLSLCDDDSECTGGTLCCSNGCGFSCIAPDANGTSIGEKFLKQKRVSTTEKITTTTEEEETEEIEETVTTAKTTKKSPVVSGCTKGGALRHTDGNILICGFAAGDFACPPTHSCTFDTSKGKFVCCLRDDNAPVPVESQINPCPVGEPLPSVAGGKLTCNGGATGPCPQGSFCIVGVCCPVVPRPFTGPAPNGVGGADFSQKPGQCPISQPTPVANCPNECRFDGDCLGPAKCCFVGCGSKCTEPIPFGVDPNLPFNPNSFANNFPAGVERQTEPRQQSQQRFISPPFNSALAQGPNVGSSNVPDGSFQNPNPVRFSNVPNNFQPQPVDFPPPLATRNFPNGDVRQIQLPNQNRQGPPFNGENRQGPFINGDRQGPFVNGDRPGPFGNGDRQGPFGNGDRQGPFGNGDRQGSFNFAGNSAPTLNLPSQPNFNIPQPSVSSLNQPSQQSVPPASQQFPQAPFPIPVPNPDFVPFPNGPFTNPNSPVPFSNGPQNGQVINSNVFERRNDSPNPQIQQKPVADLQKSQPLIESSGKNVSSIDVCQSIQCPPCHRCKAASNEPKCVRILDCCPDGTTPLGCAQNPCDFARCPSHPTAHCVPDSCGICKGVFFDQEGNNVSC